MTFPDTVQNVKKLSETSYECEYGGHDFHLSRMGNRWLVDKFELGVADPKDAHRDSQIFDSSEEARDYILGR